MSDALLPESFISLRRAAARLGLPASWLRAEALAGRVPCLCVGRRLMLNPEAVERALLDRAERAAPRSDQ